MNLNNGKIKFGIIALIVVILLIIAGVVTFILRTPHEPGTGEGDDVPPVVDEKTPAEKTIVDAVRNVNNDSRRDIEIVFPRISNLSDYRFQEYMNDQIRANVVAYQDEINIVADENTPATTKYKYKVNYNTYANDKYLSIILNQDYQTGGMRSNSWKDTFNIDVVANREVLLKELFDSKTDYQKEIIKEINAQATTKNYDLVEITTIPDRQKFYIKDQKLVIYFDPAAVAPYVQGELHFEMPFTMRDGKFYAK